MQILSDVTAKVETQDGMVEARTDSPDGGKLLVSVREGEGVPAINIGQPLTSAEVSVGEARAYDGEPVTPAVTVMLGYDTLVENADYELSYADNVDAGMATVTVTGIGKYAGTERATF